MIVGILQEPSFETRVSMLAETVSALVKKQVAVWVESDAGNKASCRNSDYEKAGASIRSRQEIITNATVLLSIHPPNDVSGNDWASKILIGVYQPLYKPSLMQGWAKNNITTFSLDLLPRTTRAQSMDVLSSQANIAGYKAILLAANIYPRYLPMLMTAAGSIAPAKVLILGAGVAGLQAIATARRLGAVVEVFDTRPAVKEEVISLGARFVEVEGAADASKAGGYAVEQTEVFLQRQKEKIAESCIKADIIITTAQIPGKAAPILITTAMLERMKTGSVIIDLAAATGGNTEQAKNNEIIVYNGVTIVGNSALPATMPADASKLYGKNVFNFLQLLINKEGGLNLAFDDELVQGCCITHNGAVVHEKVIDLL
jgi:NAD(P) transhydrogenase subunit alpha